MSNDAEQPQDDTAPKTPKVHTATLSEPKADAGGKPAKPKKAKKQKPEPATPMGKLWHNWVKPIGSVVLLVVVFRSMLLDWNDVPTGSMEPEIHVGDRIAVNRLAYGLQFPLTGPQIGIPFTPIQFDNPLDGIPQIEWGSGPARGDIVTFWNPISSVRMVKRIVAVPGDTIELRGGVMIINGETAAYTDLDPVAEELPLKTVLQGPNPSAKLTYQSETLLGLTRTVQHIEKTWASDHALLRDPQGQTVQLRGKTTTVTKKKVIQNPNDPTQSVSLPVDTEVPIDTYLKDNPELTVVFRIIDGTPYMGGEPVSYNTFAAFALKPFESGSVADTLKKIGLGVAGHELLVDGQAVFSEQFGEALRSRLPRLTEAEHNTLHNAFIPNFNLLRDLLRTNFGPYTVPEDGYLMIGDNRNNSSDGRYFGPVMRSEITGKAFAVAFSFKDNKMFTLPPDPAWSRFFKDLD